MNPCAMFSINLVKFDLTPNEIVTEFETFNFVKIRNK